MNASKKSQINFRSIRREDLVEIKKLHESMFPVRYSDDYFVGATENRGINNGKLQTIIAEDADTKEIAGFLFYQYLNMNECEDMNMFFSDPYEVGILSCSSALRLYNSLVFVGMLHPYSWIARKISKAWSWITTHSNVQ